MTPLINTLDVATLLGCSPRTVRDLVDRGALVAVRFGKVLRFDPADVARFIARGKTGKVVQISDAGGR